jgi:hypothetical protein
VQIERNLSSVVFEAARVRTVVLLLKFVGLPSHAFYTLSLCKFLVQAEQFLNHLRLTSTS